PLRALVDAGIPVGAGTDATRVSGYNPWLSLYWMVTGKTLGGTQLASAGNRLTREEALRLYAIGVPGSVGRSTSRAGSSPDSTPTSRSCPTITCPFPMTRSARSSRVDCHRGRNVVYSAPPFS